MLGFLVYYILFYKNLSDNQSLPYWKLMRFPLFPASVEDLKLIKTISFNYLSVFGKFTLYLIIGATPVGLFHLFKKKSKHFPVFASFLVLLVLIASWLGFYGMLNRILIFIIPIHALVVVSVVRELNQKWKFIGFLSALLVILINISVLKNLDAKSVYRNDRELRSLIEYLGEKPNQKPIYIYRRSIPHYEYYTGFNAGLTTTPETPIFLNNIIYGSSYENFLFRNPYSWEFEIEQKNLLLNAEAIEACESVFLLMGESPEKSIEALFKLLRYSGTISEIKNVKNTKLFLYEKIKD